MTQHSQRTHRRRGIVAAALAACLTLPVLSACSQRESADLSALRGALTSGDFRGVPLEGATAAGAAEQYRSILAGLGELTPSVTVGKPHKDGDGQSATVHWRWSVSGRTWKYDSTVGVIAKNGRWYAKWAPTVVYPRLHSGDALQRRTLPASRGDILGAGKTPLITARPVTVFGIDKSKVSAAQAVESAKALARFLGVDVDAFAARVASGGASQFVEAITFRRNEAPPLTAAVTSIPGALALQQEQQLGPYRGFATGLLGSVGPVTAEIMSANPGTYRAGDTVGLGGLEQQYDASLRGTAGAAISLVSADGQSRELFHVAPKAGRSLATTLDERLQGIAEGALSKIGPASALVAIRPSDGAVLAAANGPGTGAYNAATTGHVPPGSTFKMFDSLALIRAGLTADSTVSCTPTTVVDGYRFTNDPWYPASALGNVPLKTAVAQSCNTAFINARGKIADINGAAATLGFGLDYDAGFDAYSGQIPKPATQTEAAADLIGQGKVLASPLAMATAIASIQGGRTVLPTLLDGRKTAVPATVKPLTAAEDQQLKVLFREVVLTGTAAELRSLPGPPVIAKTGTAEFDQDGKRMTHAWMVAAQGGLAVAVFVDTGETGASTAGPIVKKFLSDAVGG